MSAAVVAVTHFSGLGLILSYCTRLNFPSRPHPSPSTILHQSPFIPPSPLILQPTARNIFLQLLSQEQAGRQGRGGAQKHWESWFSPTSPSVGSRHGRGDARKQWESLCSSVAGCWSALYYAVGFNDHQHLMVMRAESISYIKT